MLDGLGLGTLINLFIITPSAVFVGLLLKYLYTCPFTETAEFQRKYSKYQSVVLFFGRLAIVPIMVIMVGSLIIACLFSTSHRIPMIIVNYFLYVQLYGIVLAVAKVMLLFVDNYYYQLSLFGALDIVCVGRVYKERIMVEQLVVDVDYAFRINNYLFGLVKVQQILNREDAIKAKWITTVGGNDIVMKSLADEKVEYAGSKSGDSFLVTENPIYSIATNKMESAGTVDSFQVTNTHRELLLQQQQSAAIINREVVDEDAVLYLEYQRLQSSHDDTVYDMTTDDTEISFEEWKVKRKQFKHGTRGSFVKAFQVFEEREKVALDNLEHSASAQNTMHLHTHNLKRKVVLASARSNKNK
jgi:hypothetical protein